MIVEPLYDKVDAPLPGSRIIIPRSTQDPQAKQGYVVASGPTSEYHYPDLILFKPFLAEPFERDGRRYLQVPDRHIVAKVDDGPTLVPRSTDVLVLPDWSDLDQDRKKGSLYLPHHTVRDDILFPLRGKVLVIGAEVREVAVGDLVYFPVKGGHEVPFFHDGIIVKQYLIPENILLATYDT